MAPAKPVREPQPRGVRRAKGGRADAGPTLRRPLLVPAVVVVAATLLTFAPILRNGFIDWDDPTAIAQNPRLNPPTLAGLAHYWATPRLGEEFYVPLNYTSFWLLAALSRATDSGGAAVQAWPFHATSWLAHAVNALLVLLILYRLTAHRWAAAAGAALFALHPVQVEPLAWASSLYSALSGVFALTAVWEYLQFSDVRFGPSRGRGTAPEGPAELPATGRRRATLDYLLGALAYVTALLTKPTTVPLPIMIAAIELALRGRRLRDVALPLGLWMLAAAPIILLAHAAERAAPVYVPSPPWRVLVGLDSVAFYLYKLVAPLWLCPDYGRSPRWLLAQSFVYWTWVIPAVLLAVAWNVRRAARWPLACVLLFVAALLPTLGLVPFDYQRYSTTADRYLYLAMLAPALAFACVLAKRPTARRFAAATVAVAVLAVLSHVQAYRWRDDRTLFDHTLAVNPRSLAAHVVYGYLDAARGQDDAALAEFDQALQTNPGDAAALTHVGNIYLRRGRFEEAAAAYREALVFGGGHPALNINLGAALAQLGRTDEALAALNEAVEKVPDSADAHANLANVLTVRQDWQGARRHYEAALRLDPGSAAARRGLARLDAAGR